MATVTPAALERELAWFEARRADADRDPTRHREADMWRALATELRAYLYPHADIDGQGSLLPHPEGAPA